MRAIESTQRFHTYGQGHDPMSLKHLISDIRKRLRRIGSNPSKRLNVPQKAELIAAAEARVAGTSGGKRLLAEAEIAELRGDVRGSLQILGRAQADPDGEIRAAAHWKSAAIHESQRDYQAALSHCRSVETRDPELDILIRLDEMRILILAELQQEAISIAQKLVKSPGTDDPVRDRTRLVAAHLRDALSTLQLDGREREARNLTATIRSQLPNIRLNKQW